MCSGMKKLAILVPLVLLLSIKIIITYNYDATGYLNNTINKYLKKTLNGEFNSKIKSGNLSTDYIIDEVLSDIDRFGLNTVNVPVIIDIDDLDSSNMSINLESLDKAKKLIRKLNKIRVSIILEPYPWIKKGTLYETEWRPADINLFFSKWKTTVLKRLILDIANPYHIYALNIASNFVKIEEEEAWCDTVDYVRKYYKGLVTYRTGWWYTALWDKKTLQTYENKLNNKIFSKVDFISVSAYFELTDSDKNTVENLTDSLLSTKRYDRKENVKNELQNFHGKWNKPVFMGELGFPKKDGASMEPWNPFMDKPRNEKEQANCFEAYRRVFENESWLLGFSVFALGEHSADKNYYPGEESSEVIRHWYNK